MENVNVAHFLLPLLKHAWFFSLFPVTLLSQLLVKSVLCVCVCVCVCVFIMAQKMFTTGPNGGLWSHFYLMHSCSSCSYWLCCFICLLSVLCSCPLSHSHNLHQQCRSPFDAFTDTRESVHFVESLLLEFCTLLPPPELVLRLLQSWLLSPSPAFHLTPLLDPRFKDPKSSLAWFVFILLERGPCLSTELGMPSNHLILSHPLLLLPSLFPASGSLPVSQLNMDMNFGKLREIGTGRPGMLQSVELQKVRHHLVTEKQQSCNYCLRIHEFTWEIHFWGLVCMKTALFFSHIWLDIRS